MINPKTISLDTMMTVDGNEGRILWKDKDNRYAVFEFAEVITYGVLDLNEMKFIEHEGEVEFEFFCIAYDFIADVLSSRN